MIPFFRKIRHQLADERQIFRYARYAIGEILLVVIGILLALQINTWNEGRKQKQADQEFLNSLRIELSLDISTLERKIREFSDINVVVKAASRFLARTTAPVGADRDTLNTALSIFQRLNPFIKNIGRNDEFIGQGRLEQIDRELNQKYLTYLDNIQSSAHLYTKLGDALKEIEINQFHSKIEFRALSNDELDNVIYDFDVIRTDPFINNGLSKSMLWRSYYINSSKIRVKEAQGLKTRIDALLAAE